MRTKTKELSSHEDLLLDYAQRLRRHRSGRRALHVRLSHLARHNRQESHLRIALNAFDRLLPIYEGQIFRLSNADFMFFAIEIPDSAIDDLVLKLRLMFREDPFIELAERETESSAFCVTYDLEKDYKGFMVAVHDLVNQCEAEAAGFTPPAYEADHSAPKKRSRRLRPLTPHLLGQIEKAIDGAELSSLMRKQAIFAIGFGSAPDPVFYERYLSVDGLRNAYLPDVDLRSDPWLFRRLAEHIDLRTLDTLPDFLINKPEPTSVNLSISGVVSDQFLAFDMKYQQLEDKKKMVIEVPAVEVFADITSYLFARDFLRSKGYKICIDGLDALTFSVIGLEYLQADIEKVAWSDDLIDKLETGGRDQFAQAVERAGASRVVLCGCDDASAIDFGQSMGIRLFQGRSADDLAAQKSTPGAVVNL